MSRSSSAAAGYSGKPLYQKLGMRPGMVVRVKGAPAHYRDLVAGVEGVIFDKGTAKADIVHIFCPDKAALDAQIAGALGHVAPGGALWVSWPKKSSPLHRDLSEDDLRGAILPTGWVDVKVCAVDKDWSGLKFLRRKSEGVT